MRQSVRVVTLGVSDLERSRVFYSEGLGWEPLFAVDDVVFYQVGFGLVLALWPLEELGRDAGVILAPGTASSLGHNVDSRAEVDEVVGQARAAGATIVKEPQDAPLFNGYQAYFADPDGHMWEVAYNPGLSVDEDGNVLFGSQEG